MAEGGVGHEENDFSPEFRAYMERELYDSSRVDGEAVLSKKPGRLFWDRRDGYPDLNLPNECAEEQLGLPARVFLRKLPECAPYLSDNTLDLASSCKIKASWAVPVFENCSSTCVGVLEIASYSPLYMSLFFGDFLHCKVENFQLFGLSCLEEYKHRIMQCEDKNEGRIAAFMELKVACKSAFEIPEACFAWAWVSSRSCSDLLRCLFRLPDVDSESLVQSSGIFHIRKEHINIGSEVPISSLTYGASCGCFTMCLRSSNTAELYVVQFFLSTRLCNHKNRLSKLRLIIDTMKGCFRTFRLAYGQEWGEELPLEVIDSLKDKKNHHIEKIPATGCTPDLEFLNDGPVTLQLLSLLDQASVMFQPSVDSITDGSEAQNSNSPSLVSLSDGIEVMRVDSSYQKSHSVETISPTGCIPRQWRQPSVDSVNNGMFPCIEAQNSYTLSYTLSDPSRDSFSNGIEMMQVDSSDQASMDPSKSFEDQEQSMELNSDDRVSAVGAFKNPGIQDTNTVAVKAKVENYYTIKFNLSLSPRLVELQQEVAKRNIDPGAYDIIYTNEGEKPIGCDYDLQQWIEKSILLGNTSIEVTLRPKQPTQQSLHWQL